MLKLPGIKPDSDWEYLCLVINNLVDKVESLEKRLDFLDDAEITYGNVIIKKRGRPPKDKGG